ncbi:MAG: glycosyltransferase family 2 protein [Solirubrobacterales bacterium]|nr:glycosyltransferase family 2 protein [Solirubrobacterales bacterium]
MPISDEMLAVVVVSYNSASVLPGLLESLGPGCGEIPWHLTVADNASNDGSVETVRKLAPDAIIVQTGRNAGYAAGLNAAVAAAAPHTCVLVLNPDVRLEPGCVPELLATLRLPGTGIAVPRLSDRAGQRIDSLRREPSVIRALGDALLGARRAGRIPVLGEIVTGERRYRERTDTDWAEGSTLLISDQCWRRCGPWDESFFMYSEETEFALRARDAGLRTRYTPRARAVHLEGSTDSPERAALLAVNRVRLFRRRHSSVHSALYWSALVVREAIRAARGHATGRAALRALVNPRTLRDAPGPHSIDSARRALAERTVRRGSLI